MRLILFILFIPFVIVAQDNCEQSIANSTKKLYEKAQEAAQKRQYGKAFSLLEKVIVEKNDYANALFLYGQLKMQKKYFEQAQDLMIRGLSVCPNYSEEIYWLIASMAYEEKNYQRAAEFYQSYLRFINLDEEKKQLAQLRWDEARFFMEVYEMPVPFDPQSVVGISTEADEYLSILSPDNDIAFFTRRKKKQEIGMLREETVEEFMFSSKKNQGFSKGELMPKPFNLYDNEGGASLTIDNNELFLTICDPVNGYNNCDIYHTKRIDSLWMPLEKLLFPVNKSDTWESQPTISADGKTLLFSSIRPGGKGGSDIYSVQRKSNGSWGKLTSLSINTEGDEKSPFLHPDGQTLYFSSDGYLGLGGLDVYFVKKDTSGNWGEPQNIGYPINSEANDLGLFVSTDGKTAYFSSNKLKGKGGWDLYHFPLYKEARPERVLFLKGEVLDEFGDPLIASSISLRSVKGNELKEIEVDSQTGRYVAAVVLEKDEDVILTVEDDFYAFNSQYISSEDKVFEKPTTLNFDMKEMREGEAIRINNIFFETDSFSLNSQAKNVLISFASFLNKRITVRVAIHGHTDNVGINEDNLLLSKKRAKSVHDFLIQNGISSDRLRYKGFGSQKPIDSNEHVEGRANNRRTEFYILEK